MDTVRRYKENMKISRDLFSNHPKYYKKKVGAFIALCSMLIGLTTLLLHIHVINPKLKKFCYFDEMYNEDFYIELSSNENTSPNNTVANFRNKIQLLKPLSGNWEVGLSEISYTKNWRNVKNNYLICIENEKLIEEDGNIVAYTNDTSAKNLPQFKCGILKAGFYVNVPQLTTEIQQQINSNIDQNIRIRPLLSYDFITKLVKIKPGRDSDGNILLPTLSVELQQILGFDSYSSVNPNYVDGEIVANRPAEINAGIHTLFVYCDIIEPQYIGDIRARLLKTVAVPNNTQYGDQIVITYNTPHYVPVLINDFEEIEIDIKDDSNQRIPFMGGRSRLKLHFRKKNV